MRTVTYKLHFICKMRGRPWEWPSSVRKSVFLTVLGDISRNVTRRDKEREITVSIIFVQNLIIFQATNTTWFLPGICPASQMGPESPLFPSERTICSTTRLKMHIFSWFKTCGCDILSQFPFFISPEFLKLCPELEFARYFEPSITLFILFRNSNFTGSFWSIGLRKVLNTFLKIQ